MHLLLSYFVDLHQTKYFVLNVTFVYHFNRTDDCSRNDIIFGNYFSKTNALNEVSCSFD